MELNYQEQHEVEMLCDLIDAVLTDNEFSSNIAVYERCKHRARDGVRRFYEAHLDHFNPGLSPDDVEVDPFKVVAWYGFFLSREVGEDVNHLIIKAAIAVMFDLLQQDVPGVAVPQKIKNEMFQLVAIHSTICKRGEEARDEFAMGMNGLYFAFNLARGIAGKTGAENQEKAKKYEAMMALIEKRKASQDEDSA